MPTTPSRKSPAQRRYNLSVILLMTGYVAALIFANWMFKRGLAHGALGYVLAVLPALPVIGVFAAVGRLMVDEADEYLRMLLVRQSLVATGFALSVATAWGFLESFGMVPHVDAYYVAILWFGGLGLGTCVNRLLERGGEA